MYNLKFGELARAAPRSFHFFFPAHFSFHLPSSIPRCACVWPVPLCVCACVRVCVLSPSVPLVCRVCDVGDLSLCVLDRSSPTNTKKNPSKAALWFLVVPAERTRIATSAFLIDSSVKTHREREREREREIFRRASPSSSSFPSSSSSSSSSSSTFSIFFSFLSSSTTQRWV